MKSSSLSAESTSSPALLLANGSFRNVRWIRSLLESKGYPLVLATTSTDALRLGRQMRFAAVVVDLSSTEGDVVEVARRLRADAALRSTPMLLVTPGPAVTSLAEAELLGSAPLELLPKPVDAASVAAAMRRLTSVKRGEQHPTDGG